MNMDGYVRTRVLADALEELGWSGWPIERIDGLVARNVVPGGRDGTHTTIHKRLFLEHAIGSHNAGQEQRANVRAREAPVGPDRPIIITGFAGGPIVLTDGPSRTRGATSSGNVVEYTDAHGRRVARRDFRADFVTGE